MKRVKFWVRFPREKYEEWKLVEGLDESNVPIEAWKAYNKAFWAWKMKGAFYPLDDLEAYQIGAGEMVRAANQPLTLTRATLTTYLVAAAYKSMLKYKEREVDEKREEYRAMFDGCRVASADEATSARGEDKADREWSGRNSTSLDVQAFAESLPGLHSAEGVASARLAATCVHETLAKLGADAQAGLKAWLKADGLWSDAAKLYAPGHSLGHYIYRFAALWAPAFRNACEWVW